MADQEQAIRKACDHRGWDLLTIHTDEGISGKSVKGRPQLAAALAALDRGDADVLVCQKLDRLCRSTLDFLTLLERAKKRSWGVCVLDADLDTSTANGELMATVIAAFAQHERRLIGQRTKDALAVKRAQGVLLGRPVQLDPAVRARIISERAAGRTLRAIAGDLNTEGVPTAQGGAKWWPGTVRLIASAAA